jgi:uncharacterized protein (TIGR02453 family)
MDLSLALNFLKSLSKNNNREWFEKNKSKYLEAKATFEDAVASLLNEFIKFDDRLGGLDPKKLPFRIYRDVRFSKDKSPYKNNMGAGFSPNGKLIQEPGYYFHLEPGNKSMIAGGIYMPDATNLSKIRQEIDYNADVLKKIVNDKKFKTNFEDFSQSDKLKTMPKGYPKDHPHGEWLKLKSFIVIHTFTDKEVGDKKFLKNVAAIAKSMKPMNDFLREAITSA